MSQGRLNGTRRAFLKCGTLGLLGFAAAPAYASRRRCGPAPDLDLSHLSKRIELLRRSQWTATPTFPERLRRATGFDRVTVHHAGAMVNCHVEKAQVVYDLQGVLDTHVQRRYGDVGYHFIVDYAGRAWEGRSLAYQGAHVLRENQQNIGIMLLGNFEKQKPSSAQVSTLETLSEFLMEAYGIRKRRLYGHRDLGHSLCPGKYLYAYVVDWKSALSSQSRV